jgi:hypothetical protein
MSSHAESGSESDELHIDVTSSLAVYFHDELTQLSKTRQVVIPEDTLWYLSTLLENYSRSENFFDFNSESGVTLTPLADYYRYSVEADNDRERRLHLRRLGDVSIFVAGLFSKALDRKAVDIDYYIAMGESAYGYLAETPSHNASDRALENVYSTLAARFPVFTSLLGLLRAQSNDTAHLIEERFTEGPGTVLQYTSTSVAH